MLDAIIDGIVGKLADEFGSGCRIYTEQVRQGLTEPCFIVSLVNPASERFFGNRHFRSNLFSVQYVPKSETDAKAECCGVQDALFLALECISAGGGLLRGTSMSGEFAGGVLTFLVNYNMFIYVEPEKDPMETLTVENGARG